MTATQQEYNYDKVDNADDEVNDDDDKHNENEDKHIENKKNNRKIKKSLSKSTRDLVNKMDEKNHFCLCSCCNHNCCAQIIATLIVIGSILYSLISIMTPIGAVIGGEKFNKIFNEYYTISEINEICNNKFDEIFIWNGFDLGTLGQQMHVFGIIDLVFILCFAVCLCSYFSETYINNQLNWTVTINIIVRVFFMICWIIFGALIINIYIQFNNECDQNTNFAKEMNDIFTWLLPIFLISIICSAITFIITFICCLCYCQLDFRFF